VTRLAVVPEPLAIQGGSGGTTEARCAHAKGSGPCTSPRSGVLPYRRRFLNSITQNDSGTGFHGRRLEAPRDLCSASPGRREVPHGKGEGLVHEAPVPPAEVGEGVRPEDVAIPVETEPYKIAQVDFGELGKLFSRPNQNLRRASVLVMAFGYRRHVYARIVFDQTVETWLWLHTGQRPSHKPTGVRRCNLSENNGIGCRSIDLRSAL